MICRKCNQENEFYQGQSICKDCYNSRYMENYNLKRKEKAEKSKITFPQARCESCDTLFDLDFHPARNYARIPEMWLCLKCNINK